MQPITPLMNEHGLIEQAVAALAAERTRVQKSRMINRGFIARTADFFRVYADRTHHGKEEAILFRDLAKKPLTAEHRATLQDLLGDHTAGRKLVTELADGERWAAGDAGTIKRLVELTGEIVVFYPMHIAKEERGIFLPGMAYFTTAEQEAMLMEFWEYDRQLIHIKYKAVVETLLAQGKADRT